VQWNGTTRSTSFVSGTELQAQIGAPDIAAVGSATVTVVNPSPGGGTSGPLTFTIGNYSGNGFAATVVSLTSNDIVWDPVHQVIYASVPSTAGANANSIIELNPATAQTSTSQFAGSEPDVLAISNDGQFLYAGLDGSSTVQRFTLPGLGTDINYSLGSSSILGPYFALDLQVAPGSPHTTAVSRGSFNVSPAADGGIVIFDDATPRPTIAKGFGGGGTALYDSLQWGANATALYAANNEDSSCDFYALTVDSSGVTLANDYPNTWSESGIRIHYDSGTGLLYSDDGHVVNPANGALVGTFQVNQILTSGLMVPDSTLNTAFFLGQAQAQFGTGIFTIESFDLTHFTPINSVFITNVTGIPLRLIRWGKNGLAFNTNGGQVFLIAGNFVGPAAQQVDDSLPSSHVQKTWETPKKYSLPSKKE
jgi:hypothetical protein